MTDLFLRNESSVQDELKIPIQGGFAAIPPTAPCDGQIMSKKNIYLGVPDGGVYPKNRVVFKSGKHLNIFGANKMNTDGEWTLVWDYRGKLFMYHPDSVDWIEVDEGPARG